MEDRELSRVTRPVGDIKAVIISLNGCRTTVEKLLRTDPTFPAPWMLLNKRQWFMDEVEAYKQAQPRRVYAAVVAVLAMVSITALSFVKSLLA